MTVSPDQCVKLFIDEANEEANFSFSFWTNCPKPNENLFWKSFNKTYFVGSLWMSWTGAWVFRNDMVRVWSTTIVSESIKDRPEQNLARVKEKTKHLLECIDLERSQEEHMKMLLKFRMSIKPRFVVQTKLIAEKRSTGSHGHQSRNVHKHKHTFRKLSINTASNILRESRIFADYDQTLEL